MEKVPGFNSLEGQKIFDQKSSEEKQGLIENAHIEALEIEKKHRGEIHEPASEGWMTNKELAKKLNLTSLISLLRLTAQ